MSMKFRAIVRKDGKIVTEVMDRGQHLCSEVYKVTNAVGKQLSDAEIGPECDKVNEVIASKPTGELTLLIEEKLDAIRNNEAMIAQCRAENVQIRADLREGERLLARRRVWLSRRSPHAKARKTRGRRRP